MNTLKNVILYNIMRFKYSALIVSLVLLGISLLTKILSLNFGEGHVDFSGHELVLAIFIFVCFIASNKEDFNHLSINGVTRKNFFVGRLLFIPIASFVLVIVTWVSVGFAKLLKINANASAVLFYTNSTFLEITIWIFSLFILLSLIGWLFGNLFYKYGKIAVFTIIFLPQILIVFFTYLALEFKIQEELSALVNYYFGKLNGSQPLIASLNFLITAVIIALINWAFIRKMPIKT